MINKVIVSFVVMMMLVTGAFAIADSGLLENVSADTTSPEEIQNTVVVTGSGKLSIAPDVAYVNLGVRTSNEDAAMAQSENSQIMTDIFSALKAAGINEEEIETSGYNIYQTYDYSQMDSDGDYKKVFEVSNTVKVTVLDIEKVGDIIDATAKAGANSINGINFGLLDEDKYYADALKIAMESANSKATAIMSTFGKEPGLPVTVVELSYGGVVNYNYSNNIEMESMAMKSDVSTPITSGDVDVNATVTVTYTYN